MRGAEARSDQADIRVVYDERGQRVLLGSEMLGPARTPVLSMGASTVACILAYGKGSPNSSGKSVD